MKVIYAQGYLGEPYNQAITPDLIESLYKKQRSVLNLAKHLYKIDGSFAIAIEVGQVISAFVDPLSEEQLYFKEGFHGDFSDCSLFNLKTVNPDYIPAEAYKNDVLAFKDTIRIKPFSIYEFKGGKFSGINYLAEKFADWHTVLPTVNFRKEKLEDVLLRRLAPIKNADASEVGLFYSGGLDSGVVKAVMDKYGFKYTLIELDRLNGEYAPEKDLDYYISIMQEPLDLGGLVPEIKLFEKAAKLGVKFVVGGAGPDELFGGYKDSRGNFDNISNDLEKIQWNYSAVKITRVSKYFTEKYGIKPVILPWQHRKFLGLASRLPWEKRKDKNTVRSRVKGLVDESIRLKPKEPMKDLEFNFRSEQYQAKLKAAFLRNLEKDSQ